MLSHSTPELRQRFMLEFSKELLIQTAAKIPKKVIEERSIESIINKIEEILKEENIEAIECPSSYRYLIIRKNGKLKVLNMMLEEDEIQEIIKYYFKKANKQLFNPFALIFSEFKIAGLLSPRIGSRFVIKKI